MCAKVGVDPLASNKGFWAELLGIGDFYYELGMFVLFPYLTCFSSNAIEDRLIFVCYDFLSLCLDKGT